MNIISICIYAVVCACIISFVRQLKPEFTLPLCIAAGIGLLTVCVDSLLGLIAGIKSINQAVDFAYIKLLMKALGICTICKLASDLCKDAGFVSIAGRIDGICRIALCVLSLSLISQIVDMIIEICGV